MAVLAVVSTDSRGLRVLRRHPGFTVRFTAPSGTDVQTSADVRTDSDSGPVRLAYTVNEAAQAIGVSERTMRSLVASGEVRSFHVGRNTRIRVDDLEQYVARCVEAGEQAS